MATTVPREAQAFCQVDLFDAIRRTTEVKTLLINLGLGAEGRNANNSTTAGPIEGSIAGGIRQESNRVVAMLLTLGAGCDGAFIFSPPVAAFLRGVPPSDR